MAAEISIERRDGGVAVLSLNAPDRRNALTVAMAEELVAACDQLDGDREVGAVVVRGEGGFFCAGGDRGTLEAAGRDPADPEVYAGLG
jgi:enoyl-CoA hydratase